MFEKKNHGNMLSQLLYGVRITKEYSTYFLIVFNCYDFFNFNKILSYDFIGYYVAIVLIAVYPKHDRTFAEINKENTNRC